MATEPKGGQSAPAAPRARQPPSETGPYVLRTLLEDVPLSADGGDEDIKINCVDYLGAVLRTMCPR